MAFKDVVNRMGVAILNNKMITFLSVALFAFVITTIVLASENNSNADALADCQARLWQATTVTPPATTTLKPEQTSVTEAEGTSTVDDTSSTTEAPPEKTKIFVNLERAEQMRRR